MSYINQIESWWRHLGCYDRVQVTELPYDCEANEYLKRTDDFWDSLTDKEKTNLYLGFFSED